MSNIVRIGGLIFDRNRLISAFLNDRGDTMTIKLFDPSMDGGAAVYEMSSAFMPDACNRLGWPLEPGEIEIKVVFDGAEDGAAQEEDEGGDTIDQMGAEHVEEPVSAHRRPRIGDKVIYRGLSEGEAEFDVIDVGYSVRLRQLPDGQWYTHGSRPGQWRFPGEQEARP